MCAVTAAASRGTEYIYMCVNPIHIKFPKGSSNPYHKYGATVGCGRCVECLKLYSIQWATRCFLESLDYQENSMFTLTYKNECLPFGSELCKRDYQLFLKLLRYHLGDKHIRYFGCGEYGSLAFTQRPHFHIIIFGFKPSDLRFLYSDNGIPVFTSKFVESVWQRGNVAVSDVNFRSSLYCAKYLQKLNSVDNKKVQPFTFMSRKPGIGYNYASNLDGTSDWIYLKGRRVRLPRYFLDVMEKNGVDLSDIKYNRFVGSLFDSVDKSINYDNNNSLDLLSEKIPENFLVETIDKLEV